MTRFWELFCGLSGRRHAPRFSDGPTLSSRGTIIGQPALADYRYSFDFDTTTPFKMDETVLNNYKHLPKEGVLKITDRYDQVIEVKQNQPESLKATVYFNGSEIDDLFWSTIIGDKN